MKKKKKNQQSRDDFEATEYLGVYTGIEDQEL